MSNTDGEGNFFLSLPQATQTLATPLKYARSVFEMEIIVAHEVQKKGKSLFWFLFLNTSNNH